MKILTETAPVLLKSCEVYKELASDQLWVLFSDTILTGNLSETNASVLILNEIHQPVLAHQNGEITHQLMVNFDKRTSAGGSCSVVWENEFYIYGGNLDSTKRQISKLDGCMLKGIDILNFDFENGACTNFDDKRVYLCFSRDEPKQCRFALDAETFLVEYNFNSTFWVNFKNKEKSNYQHRLIRIASSKSKS